MIHSVYPVLMTEKLQESAIYYQTCFGFKVAFSNQWYVSLKHPNGNELALIDAGHDTIPQQYRGTIQGMILNIEVEDAAAMFEELGKTIDILQPLKEEAYGQRHFMVQDPNGILIDVIQEIPMSGEYAEQNSGGMSK